MKLIPNYYVKNIYEIPISFFKENNIKFILCDLDNTLDAYDVYTPCKKALKLKEELIKENIKIFIISNNKGKRVENYAKNLGVKYLSSSNKPFAFKINRFIKEQNINKEETVLIGDQLLTDIKAGLRVGIKTVLCDKLVDRDQFTTRFNRLIDNPLRKRYKRKGLLKYVEFK